MEQYCVEGRLRGFETEGSRPGSCPPRLRIVAPLLADGLDSDQSDTTEEEKTEDHLLNIVRMTRPDLEPTGTAGRVLSRILRRSK